MKIKMIDFKIMGDERGSLIALEEHHNVPFDVKRIYYIFGTKKDVRRGYHAHRDLKQLAICISGSCKFLLDDGKNKQHIELNSPTHGLLIEGLIWREMYDFSDNCVLMVLADNYYTANDYIRDYEQFLQESLK
ncbi:MAG: FdtA/QdtA family cupin domain-containing protein [Sulfurospirillaceae bacterium]|nr:FdtA/QdtA family cupin domain-containing protein [Sulfurospirillaceae bacterium]MDD2826317.1 FdtA/QdtA family cupin domain-containing protein [Sulfurospirillaceae bacterium]